MRAKTIVLPALVALTMGCDEREESIGVHRQAWRTAPGEQRTDQGESCVMIAVGLGEAGAGGSGPEYSETIETKNEEIHFRYFIATEENAGKVDFVTPENGELVAELVADMEFYDSGDSQWVEFDTYDGISFEIEHWGTADCEDM